MTKELSRKEKMELKKNNNKEKEFLKKLEE